MSVYAERPNQSTTTRPQAARLAGVLYPSENPPELTPFQRVDLRVSAPPISSVATPKTSALGRQVGSRTPPSTFDLNRIKRERLKLTRISGRLLGNKAVSDCGVYMVPGAPGVELTYDPGSNAAGFRGVQHCNLPWVCAIDDARDRAVRSAQLQEASARILARGWYLALATFTVQHRLGEAYGDVLDDLCAALTKTRRGAPWTRIKAKFGILAGITVLEPLYSFETGPHPHKHALVILNHRPTPEDVQAMQDAIGARFVKMAKKLGRRVSTTYGVAVTTGPSVARYICKWTDVQELTSQGKQSASCTPFELLLRYDQGNAQAGAIFVQYATAIKGRRRLVWSRGLKAALSMQNWTPEDQSQDALPETVLVMDGAQWRQVCTLGKRSELLSVTVATCGNAAAIWHYLVEVCRVHYDPDAAQQRMDRCRDEMRELCRDHDAQVRARAVANSVQSLQLSYAWRALQSGNYQEVRG